MTQTIHLKVKKTMDKNTIKFLKGLRKLTKETGLEIGGCGCCGSPFLTKVAHREGAGYALTDPNRSNSGVRWVSPDDEYDWDEYKNHIVK